MTLIQSKDVVYAIKAAWDETCCGNKNPDVCESCRAYEDAIRAVEFVAHNPPVEPPDPSTETP